MKSINLKAEEIKTLQADGKVTISRAAKLPKEWHRGKRAFSTNPHGDEEFIIYGECGTKNMYCPYGSVRDRLWVRESWMLYSHMGTFVGKAPKEQPCDLGIGYKADGLDKENIFTWRPPSQMPRWASRFDVEVKTVSVKDLDWVIEFKRIVL